MQHCRLSVSEANTESDERNGGNVIRLGEDLVREEEGMSRRKEGVGRPRVPLSTVSQFSHTGGQFGSLLQLKSQGATVLRDVNVLIPLVDEGETLTGVPSAIPKSRHRGNTLPAATSPAQQ